MASNQAPACLDRRSFLALGAAGAVGATASAAHVALPARASAPSVDLGADFPRTTPDRTAEFVRLCHFDLDGVRERLAEDRSLALAAWDWGFGDWETALGAASHVGRRDIIDLLLTHGARPDHFTAAALDDVAAVRAACTALPGLQRRGGPHGITLLQHARNGNASRVIAYLEELGDADERPVDLPLTDVESALLAGRYAFDGDGGVPLLVERGRRGGIGILRAGGTFRALHRREAHDFSPAGAPHVVVRFGFAPAAVETRGHATGLEIQREGRDTPTLSARYLLD